MTGATAAAWWQFSGACGMPSTPIHAVTFPELLLPMSPPPPTSTPTLQAAKSYSIINWLRQLGVDGECGVLDPSGKRPWRAPCSGAPPTLLEIAGAARIQEGDRVFGCGIFGQGASSGASSSGGGVFGCGIFRWRRGHRGGGIACSWGGYSRCVDGHPTTSSPVAAVSGDGRGRACRVGGAGCVR